MQLADFDFSYPEEQIAQFPLKERDQSKLLIVDRKKEDFSLCDFYDIHHFFEEGDVLVVNNTQVMKARFFGKTNTGGSAEIFLLSEVSEDTWKCLVKTSKKNNIGNIIRIADDCVGEVVAFHEEVPILHFFYAGEWSSILEKYGHIPLPPYIKRQDSKEDTKAYQTIFAHKEGAVAAPTAGLHFTNRVLTLLENKGVHVVPVTLHVGYGTFQPVRCEKIEDHHMHSERFELSLPSAIHINKAKRVIAIGTTSVRVLESSWIRGEVRPGEGSTDLFIYPGFQFKVTQGMVTNFHQPRSTLLMLVSAFGGVEKIKKAYHYAISHNCRLFSYGDCMLIL
ncbi:MAG: tRNA preQ1(34) S-adenosylmethionine ribosyltransferase-isomerase QueA [Deltaproteobacteria bacterium]|nr:tRNA preQ1(34) S-adenosylmethionine ribosyltransferase-isomerase QueA [Deltaproteobacteria bacterium]